MSQFSPTIGANKSGLTYRQEDNDGKKALLNHHKGAAAPSYAEAGMLWLDDAATPWVLKAYDGADWIAVLGINATTNAVMPYLGTAALKLLNYAEDTGSADAYAVAPVPAISAYATGQIVFFKPSNANTGAATLAVSGLAAKALKTQGGASLSAGALQTSGLYLAVYNGTDFTLLNAGGTAGLYNTGTSGAVIGLLNGSNIHSGDNTFSASLITPGRDYSATVSIADDAAASFTPPNIYGKIFVVCNVAPAFHGEAFFNTSTATSMVAGTSGSSFNITVAEGTLSGTTGTDARITIRASNNGNIYIENRTGGTRTVFYKILC